MAGCGSSSQDVLYIEAPTYIIKVGERVALTAQATEVLASPPEWDVQELDGGSFMRATGQQVTYLAPPLAGNYHVVARATRANGQKARAVQVIVVQPLLSIEPSSARVAQGGTCAFSVKVKGIEPPKIQWGVEEPDGGSVSPAGVYTAPARPGTFRVVATALTEGHPLATATVRVD